MGQSPTSANTPSRCRARQSLDLSLESRRVDALQEELHAVDIAINSLFLHHLTDRDATTVLRNLARCPDWAGSSAT